MKENQKTKLSRVNLCILSELLYFGCPVYRGRIIILSRQNHKTTADRISVFAPKRPAFL
jgi:hypothetical protein